MNKKRNRRPAATLLLLAVLLLAAACRQQAPVRADTGEEAVPRTGIVLAGSSITWGTGGTWEAGSIQDRYAGEVVKYLLTELSTTVVPAQMTFSGDTALFRNKLLWQGEGVKLSGMGASVEFDLYGDELALCQAALRTSAYGIMEVTADGEIIGEFSNHNSPGSGEQTFTGDGTTVKFMLDHPATYDHEVTVGGTPVRGEIYDGGWTRGVPENPGYLIIRKLDGQHRPKHCIWFRDPPPAGEEIRIKYKYGRIIAFEGGALGQLHTDEENESPYGEGSVSFDPAHPVRLTSGMEYRYIDRKAFWVRKFTEKKKRHFRIRITGGKDPYFIINFASNRYHDFMNAGIGGWALSHYLDHDGIHDYNGFFEHFMPDLIVIECATNDDWEFGARKVKHTVTGLSEEEVKRLWTLELDKIVWNPQTKDYAVTLTTGVITSADTFSLTCPQIVGSDVRAGDIVRIGTYHGDNRQVTCREIATVDLKKGQITWTQPLTPGELLNVERYEDLTGAECSVRDLSLYEKRYGELIEKIRRIAPHARILLTQPGLSNYRARQLWGYNIIHRRLAGRYPNTGTIEVTRWLYDFQQGIVTGKKQVLIRATGEKEYTLPWQGHWQGFEVWVNDRNVYGTDCYIDCGEGYGVDPEGSGPELSVDRPYDKRHYVTRNMTLVFTRNIPREGEIRVLRADTVWSPDFCHTTEQGGYVYGQVYVNKIKETIHR